MKKKVYTLHDAAVGAYLQPFFMRSNGEALRAFRQLANDPNSNVYQNPGDFSLFLIGEYDEETGRLKSAKAFKNLGVAIDYKEPLEPTPIEEDIAKTAK